MDFEYNNQEIVEPAITEAVVETVPEAVAEEVKAEAVEPVEVVETKIQEPKPIKPKVAKATQQVESETVTISSTKNVTWQGVGSVKTGNNVVAKDVAEKWLTQEFITLTTSEDAKDIG